MPKIKFTKIKVALDKEAGELLIPIKGITKRAAVALIKIP